MLRSNTEDKITVNTVYLKMTMNTAVHIDKITDKTRRQEKKKQNKVTYKLSHIRQTV